MRCPSPNNHCMTKCCCNRPNCDTSEPVGCATKRIKALINTVLDGCCKFDEVKKEVVVPIKGRCCPCPITLGQPLAIKQNGPVTCSEIQRSVNPCECDCQSTVLTCYPIKFADPCDDDNCKWIEQTFTSIFPVALVCSSQSILDCQNSRIVSMSAVVTQIENDYVVVTIALTVRICLRQTVMQEHYINVAPVTTELCKEVAPANDCSACDGTGAEIFDVTPVPFR